MISRAHFRSSIALILAVTLHSCGDAPSETAPGGVSAEDARQLDKAAEKLDTETPQNTESAGQKP